MDQKNTRDLAIVHGFSASEKPQKYPICHALTKSLKRGLQKLAPYAIISTTAKERRKNWTRRRTVTNTPRRSVGTVQGGKLNMMNKNFAKAQISRGDVLEMFKTGLVSFSFAPITVIAMTAIFSLAL